MNKVSAMAIGFLSLCSLSYGQIFTTYTFSDVNLSIPDNDLAGASDTRTISGAIGTILDVNVALTLTEGPAGAFNGDFYAYLNHESGFAVLLNRVGRSASNPFGYDDSGFQNVTFDDEADSGDIHSYRLSFSGSPVTGTWQPDARNSPPQTTLDTDPRTEFLASFDGLTPNGEWTLFLADVSAGGSARLDNWRLELTAIPEVEVSIPVAFALLITGLFYRRHHLQKAARE